MEDVEPQEEEEELPMYQEHYNALFSMDFVETRYPHVDTMKALGIFEDVELVLKNMHLAKSFFSYHMESYQGALMSFGAFWSIWDIRSMEGLGAWKQLNWTRKGRRRSHLEDQLDPTRPTGRVPQLDRPSFNSIELGSQSQTRKMLLPP
ncbi:unnamed protein product [Microthlaspi erraticum]|uniref:Arabidopsis retrotransposon Orf1 C-terminal domain-containing protein n=1 Tax=Microthlaspi erraticum TaxID=1685480 RepID=A0A6D2JDD3_9BRAS|nr:unnamed protein product [Microthlaspi erraticum]